MNVFAVIFWTLVVLAITKAATITGGWLLFFAILAIIAS